MTHDQIVKQSIQAYKQHCEKWRHNSKLNSVYDMKSFEEFRNTGVGKAVLCVANGYSFEENIETIKKYKDNVDIICCDKTLGHLLDNDITPQFCMVCDASVNYETYLEPWKDKLQDVVLFMNVCANPKWAKNGNWKDKYFYVNKDVMQYEKEFIEITGCKNGITAGTNVSNMIIVSLTQSDNRRNQNLFCYDKILLIGYDYSWKDDGKYYAFDERGSGKHNYMRHIYGISNSGKLIYTSNNLNSSGSWLNDYINAFRHNIIQCSKDALYMFSKSGDLAENMAYRHKPSDGPIVRDLLKQKLGIEAELKKINNGLSAIARDHWFASHRV